MSAQVNHFSEYQVISPLEVSPLEVSPEQPGPSADATFKQGEIYAFPNPAKLRNPTFHIEVGIAESVELRVYDVAGHLRHSVGLGGVPSIVDRGNGPRYAYEYVWDVSGVGSDVYVYVVHARKGGYSGIKVIKKVAVIK